MRVTPQFPFLPILKLVVTWSQNYFSVLSYKIWTHYGQFKKTIIMSKLTQEENNINYHI